MTRGPFTRGRSAPPILSPGSLSFTGDTSLRSASLGQSAVATSATLCCVTLRVGSRTRSPGEGRCSSRTRSRRGEVTFFGLSSTTSFVRTSSRSSFSSPTLFTVRFRAGKRTRSPSTRSPLLPKSASPLLGILFTSLSLSISLPCLSPSPGLLAILSSITRSSRLDVAFRSSRTTSLSFWGDGPREGGLAAGTGTGT